MNIQQPPNAAFLVGLVIYIGIRHIFVRRTQGEQKRVRRVDGMEKLLLAAMSVAVMLLPVIYLLTPWLSRFDYRLPESVRWCGAIVMIGSLWLFWRSHTDLGQNWSVSLEVRAQHELVTSGIYRRVRHPMYASIWLWVIAQAMLLPNWLAGWSALLAFAAMYFIRTPREEQLMLETFGEAYRGYCRRTGRIFPRLRGFPEADALGASPEAGDRS